MSFLDFNAIFLQFNGIMKFLYCFQIWISVKHAIIIIMGWDYRITSLIFQEWDFEVPIKIPQKVVIHKISDIF